MASTGDIKRRIKSISSTKKITKAMEMVAVVKMRKAIESVLRTRSYANLSWLTILNLSQAINNSDKPLHPLLEKRNKIKKTGVILITSNRGLCGGFNTAIINKINNAIKKHCESEGKLIKQTEFILIGKKGVAVYNYFGYNIVADFPKYDVISEVKEILPISQLIIKEYLEKKYDQIFVAYTDYINTTKQIPRVKQLLPIDITAEDEHLGIVGQDLRLGIKKSFMEENVAQNLKQGGFTYEYTFEPNPTEVLDEMLPRLIEIQLFQALLESNASEHSARMTAMRQATDAAGDMVDELTLFYNKARQAGITAEIAEISAGANAMKND
ncbi:MAG: ATP synthase F1 subunit gamma [Patescibacteria group bacterium]